MFVFCCSLADGAFRGYQLGTLCAAKHKNSHKIVQNVLL